MAPKRIIVITGTPGVGKTTLCASLKKSTANSSLYDATSIVNKSKLFSRTDKFGAKVVRMNLLERKIAELIRKDKNPIIIFEGHLLADLKIQGAVAIVLREHLGTVKARLLRRGYATEKIRENIVSEALDYCGAAAYDNYSTVHEIMNDKSAQKRIISIIKGRSKKGTEAINLLEELVGVIKSDRKFAI